MILSGSKGPNFDFSHQASPPIIEGPAGMVQRHDPLFPPQTYFALKKLPYLESADK